MLLKSILICLATIMIAAIPLEAQVIAVDEFCISNTFTENGTLNERSLYGPVAGIYVFWDSSNDKWTIGSLDKTYVYYTSDDNSIGPGCSSTFDWTAPIGSECDEATISGVSCSTILPVEYLSIRGFRVENLIKLEWQTAVEINNEGFEVQRSVDGVNFSEIGWVKGNGTTNFTSAYDFNDRDNSDHISYYYRLNQKDYNGESEISPVVFVNGNKISNVRKIYFKSMSNEINIFAAKPEANMNYKIFQADGKLVKASNLELNKGDNFLYVDDLPSGVFLFHLGDEIFKFTKL